MQENPLQFLQLKPMRRKLMRRARVKCICLRLKSHRFYKRFVGISYTKYDIIYNTAFRVEPEIPQNLMRNLSKEEIEARGESPVLLR